MLFVFWATSRAVEVWFIFLCVKKEVLRDVAKEGANKFLI